MGTKFAFVVPLLLLALTIHQPMDIAGSAGLYYHETCRGWTNERECLGPTSIFATSDQQVVSFLYFRNVGKVNIAWEWVDPAGDDFAAGNYTLDASGPYYSYTVYDSMHILHWYPSGNWTVKVFVNSKYVLSDKFEISSKDPLDVWIGYAPNIPKLNATWSDVWKNATRVDLVNWGQNIPSYRFGGMTGFAYVWLMHDASWLYGLSEYYPPSDVQGVVVGDRFQPSRFWVYIDSNGDKSYVPQTDDYEFVMFSTLAPIGYSAHRGRISFTNGTGNIDIGRGGWQANPDIGDAPTLNDCTKACFAFSVAGTPTFKTPHPIYQFMISMNILPGHPFGLGFFVFDNWPADGVVFGAAFPANEIWGTGGEALPDTLDYHPSVWADAYLTPKSTTTTSSASITQTFAVTSTISSNQSVTNSSMNYSALFGTKMFSQVFLIALIAIGTVGLLFRRRLRDGSRSVQPQT